MFISQFLPLCRHINSSNYQVRHKIRLRLSRKLPKSTHLKSRTDATMQRAWKTQRAWKASQCLLVAALTILPLTVNAKKPVHCDSGNPANWLSTLQMNERLTADGWRIDSIVKKNGCWKVTGNNPQGRKTTSYFHPLSAEKQ